MPSLSDEKLSEELKENMEVLKDSARLIHDSVSQHEPLHHGWGSSLLFEEKLKVHKRLNSLVRQQQDLAQGIVALIKSVHDFEHERFKRQKPVLPPAPRPSRPVSLSGRFGSAGPLPEELGKDLPKLKGDPMMKLAVKKKSILDFFKKK